MLTERECLAIMWTCDKYLYYLLGRDVTVWTDHHSLCWIFHIRSPTSRLIHWALRLQEYTLTILHEASKAHVDGDCLSRYPPEAGGPMKLIALEVEDPVFGWQDIILEQRKTLSSPPSEIRCRTASPYAALRH